MVSCGSSLDLTATRTFWFHYNIITFLSTTTWHFIFLEFEAEIENYGFVIMVVCITLKCFGKLDMESGKRHVFKASNVKRGYHVDPKDQMAQWAHRHVICPECGARKASLGPCSWGLVQTSHEPQHCPLGHLYHLRYTQYFTGSVLKVHIKWLFFLSQRICNPCPKLTPSVRYLRKNLNG